MLKRSGVVVFVALIAGCTVHPSSQPPDRLPKATPETSTLRDDDPEMDAAIERARRSLDSFITRLQNPQPREVFSIEASFPTPDGGREHLWIDDVVFRNEKFRGKLRSKPSKAASVKPGQEVSAAKSDVTDWMILTSGHSEGGFTVDVRLRRQGQPR